MGWGCLCVGWGAAGVGEGSCVSAEVGVGGWLWRLAGCLRGEVREAGVEAGAVDEGKKIKLKINKITARSCPRRPAAPWKSCSRRPDRRVIRGGGSRGGCGEKRRSESVACVGLTSLSGKT